MVIRDFIACQTRVKSLFTPQHLVTMSFACSSENPNCLEPTHERLGVKQEKNAKGQQNAFTQNGGIQQQAC
jgi:hypothetical protein